MKNKIIILVVFILAASAYAQDVKPKENSVNNIEESQVISPPDISDYEPIIR